LFSCLGDPRDLLTSNISLTMLYLSDLADDNAG